MSLYQKKISIDDKLYIVISKQRIEHHYKLLKIYEKFCSNIFLCAIFLLFIR